MNKNTTFQKLIQNFLSEAELEEILTEFAYKDTARKCTVSVLLSHLTGAAVNGWKSFRHSADVGPSTGLVSLVPSSLSKKMAELDYAIMKRIFEVISGKLNRKKSLKSSRPAESNRT